MHQDPQKSLVNWFSKNILESKGLFFQQIHCQTHHHHCYHHCHLVVALPVLIVPVHHLSRKFEWVRINEGIHQGKSTMAQVFIKAHGHIYNYAYLLGSVPCIFTLIRYVGPLLFGSSSWLALVTSFVASWPRFDLRINHLFSYWYRDRNKYARGTISCSTSFNCFIRAEEHFVLTVGRRMEANVTMIRASKATRWLWVWGAHFG